jgi:hypothetical protein
MVILAAGGLSALISKWRKRSVLASSTAAVDVAAPLDTSDSKKQIT